MVNPIPETWQPFARPSGSPVRMPKLAPSVCGQRTHWGLIVVHKGYVQAFTADPVNGPLNVWWQGNETGYYCDPWRYHPNKFAEFLVAEGLGDCLLVGLHVTAIVADLARVWMHYPHFEVAASPIKQPGNGKDWSWMGKEYLSQFRPDDPEQETDVTKNGVHVKYIGWKQKGHGPYVRRHFPIDPYTFGLSLPKKFKAFSLEEMVEWAKDLQDWFNHEQPQTGNGGHTSPKRTQPAPAFHKVASGLIRAFFNEGPSYKLNERIRGALPGNFYANFANVNICYPKVWEFDQSAAHHYSATRLTFPSKVGLSSYGYHDPVEDKAWKRWDDPELAELLDGRHGLLRVGGFTRHVKDTLSRLVIPPANREGTWHGWLFTNELPYLDRWGIHPEYVCAAFLSDLTDDGPNRYGAWALEQLAKAGPLRKDWLKPMLLSTYGMLGARPFTWQEARLRGKGESLDFHMGKDKWLPMAYKKAAEWHGSYVNIIHRGMIEADTRAHTIEVARMFVEAGYDLLAVYADGVYVAANRKDVPLLPTQWRQTTLTNAHFPTAGQVICDQYAKLPGFSGSVRKQYLTLYGKVKERG